MSDFKSVYHIYATTYLNNCPLSSHTLPLKLGCRTLASIHTMMLVLEHTIGCFFSGDILPPQATSLELPPDTVNGYGWKYITNALSLPEDSTDDICKNCISEYAVLIMHAQLMLELPYCTSSEQEFRIAVKVVQWCTQLKPR